MPPLAPIAVAIGGAVASGAAAVGSAAAAVGSAVTAGVSAMGGLSGLATGLSIAGSAVQAVGMLTGSKTLQKVGAITGMVGGFGMAGSALSKGMGAANTASAALNVGGQPGRAAQMDTFAKNAWGAGGTMTPNTMQGLSNSGMLRTASASMPSIAQPGQSSSGIAQAVNPVQGGMDAGMTGTPIDRYNSLLGKYDRTSAILGGVAGGLENYMYMKMQQEPAMKRLEFEKDQTNLTRSNQAAVPTMQSMF